MHSCINDYLNIYLETEFRKLEVKTDYATFYVNSVKVLLNHSVFQKSLKKIEKP